MFVRRSGGPPFGLSEHTAVEYGYVDSRLAGHSTYLKEARNGHVHILANQKARSGKCVHRYLYIDLRNSWATGCRTDAQDLCPHSADGYSYCCIWLRSKSIAGGEQGDHVSGRRGIRQAVVGAILIDGGCKASARPIGRKERWQKRPEGNRERKRCVAEISHFDIGGASGDGGHDRCDLGCRGVDHLGRDAIEEDLSAAVAGAGGAGAEANPMQGYDFARRDWTVEHAGGIGNGAGLEHTDRSIRQIGQVDVEIRIDCQTVWHSELRGAGRAAVARVAAEGKVQVAVKVG